MAFALKEDEAAYDAYARLFGPCVRLTPAGAKMARTHGGAHPFD